MFSYELYGKNDLKGRTIVILITKIKSITYDRYTVVKIEDIIVK